MSDDEKPKEDLISESIDGAAEVATVSTDPRKWITKQTIKSYSKAFMAAATTLPLTIGAPANSIPSLAQQQEPPGRKQEDHLPQQPITLETSSEIVVATSSIGPAVGFIYKVYTKPKKKT